MDHADVPRVVLVVNGPLKLSKGKLGAQTAQAIERLFREREQVGITTFDEDTVAAAEQFDAWRKYTTTITREAKTTAMFDRVCAEVPGVLMIDEGFTEVEPDTPTVFASWPAVRADEHKLLSNGKVVLMSDKVDPFEVWTDAQLVAAADALAGAVEQLGDGTATGATLEVIDALRYEAMRRHLPLGGVQPDNWLTA